jgi:hypothetical protein
VRVTAEECRRIAPGWLARERETVPARIFRQEYMCSFEDVDSQAFPTDLVDEAFTHAVQPLFAGGLR